MTRELTRQLHLWVGLLLCVPLVLIGLTGSILVIEDPLRAALAPSAKAQAGTAHSAGEIVAAARAAAPNGYVPSMYIAPIVSGGLATVRLAPPGRQAIGPGEAMRVDVDPVSLATYPNAADDFLRQVFFLHSTLLLKGREGRQVVGWLGVAMLTLAVSGLVNWWPRRANWRAAFTISPSSQGYRLWREMHGAVGIWGLAVFTVVSFGGVYLAFPDTIRTIVAPMLPARDLRAATSAVKVQPVKGGEAMGLDDAIKLAREEVPGSGVRAAFLPTRPDQPYRIALPRPGTERHETPVMVLVDPWTRKVAAVFDPRNYSAGETFLSVQHAIHAGQGLGGVWKVLVFFSGFLPALFAATGMTMWLKRRGRPRAPVIPLVDQSQTARRAGE